MNKKIQEELGDVLLALKEWIIKSEKRLDKLEKALIQDITDSNVGKIPQAIEWKTLAGENNLIDFGSQPINIDFIQGALWADQRLKEKNNYLSQPLGDITS